VRKLVRRGPAEGENVKSCVTGFLPLVPAESCAAQSARGVASPLSWAIGVDLYELVTCYWRNTQSNSTLLSTLSKLSGDHLPVFYHSLLMYARTLVLVPRVGSARLSGTIGGQCRLERS